MIWPNSSKRLTSSFQFLATEVVATTPLKATVVAWNMVEWWALNRRCLVQLNNFSSWSDFIGWIIWFSSKMLPIDLKKDFVWKEMGSQWSIGTKSSNLWLKHIEKKARAKNIDGSHPSFASRAIFLKTSQAGNKSRRVPMFNTDFSI